MVDSQRLKPLHILSVDLSLDIACLRRDVGPQVGGM